MGWSPNILVAFPYWTDVVEKGLARIKDEHGLNLIVDSGAFTAWNTGKEISMKGYCEFIRSIENFRPFNYVQFDVFGNPEASWNNLNTMYDNGFDDAMPVFTRGESLERLEQMYDMTDYIMFGGIVIGGGNKEYVKWFLENNKGRDCHWLGFVNMPFIRDYSPRSVDSSSWKSAPRFGALKWYTGGGNYHSARRKDLTDNPSKRQEVVKAMERIGIGSEVIGRLAKPSAWRFSAAHGWPIPKGTSGLTTALTTIAAVHCAYDIEMKFGTKIYLAACSGSWEYKLINASIRHLKEQGIITE